MAENIDDITIAFYQDDRNVLHQLDKVVLTRGNWTTIMFLYQELNKKTNEYEAPKVSIRRYQKRGGIYKQQSKFNISSAKQGREISKILTQWFPEGKDGEYARHHENSDLPPPSTSTNSGPKKAPASGKSAVAKGKAAGAEGYEADYDNEDSDEMTTQSDI
jgi:hypothetical protein